MPELHHPSFARQREEIVKFYEHRDYGLVWVRDNKPTLRATQMIHVLQQAEDKGLAPGDYDGDLWAARTGFGDAESDARFDLGLTVSVARYLSDLRYGRVGPSPYRSVSTEARESTSLLLEQVLSEPDLPAMLRKMEPPFDGYWRTLEALHRYRRLSTADSGEQLPESDRPIEAGTRYSGLDRLTRLLEMLGDLRQTGRFETYDAPLVEAVKHFQLRHGLEADGRIGKATRAELNTPVRTRVQQLELTLERWRQVPHSFARPPIVLNIPEFRLYAFGPSYEPELEMRIVVGRAAGFATPLLSSVLTTTIFHPYWNVPLSIQRKELIPELHRNPSYLAAHDFEIVTRVGAVVTPTINDETIAKLRAGKLLLRQRPGSQNALGSVKFVFPNEQDVYLHDTPARALFAQSRRDFSHGCIRVENPAALAAWVLRGEPDWSEDRIQEEMSGQKTISVRLREPIPVLIVYGTSVVKKNGDVYFLRDIYQYDRELTQEIAVRAF